MFGHILNGGAGEGVILLRDQLDFYRLIAKNSPLFIGLIYGAFEEYWGLLKLYFFPLIFFFFSVLLK